MTNCSDAEVVASHLAGDGKAFNELYRRYYWRVVSLAFRLTRDMELARDVAQEVFLRVVRYLHTWKHGTKFDAWIFQITYRRVSTEKARPWLLYDDHSHWVDVDGEIMKGKQPWGQPLASQFDLFAEFERQELRDLIREVIAKLPQSDQEILTLHYYEGLESPEIGAQLGIPAPTVRGRIQRARKRMREIIGDRLAA